MSFVIAFLNHDNPVHNRLLKACVVLFILDSILLTAFLFTAPSLDPPLILAGLAAFNIFYAPSIILLRRKRRRAWTIWNLTTGKVLSFASALCLWEPVTNTYREVSTGTGAAMAVVLALALVCYGIELIMLLWVLRLASHGQAYRAWKYTQKHMIGQINQGHASATSVAAGIQKQLSEAKFKVALARQMVEAALTNAGTPSADEVRRRRRERKATDEEDANAGPEQGGDSTDPEAGAEFDRLARVRMTFARADSVTKNTLEKLQRNMAEMLLFARRDFTATIVKLSLERHHFMYLATFVLLLSFSAFFIETVKIGSLQEPIFTEEDVESMREQSSQLYGASGNPLRLSEETRLHTDARVMVVLMDGLRFDHVGELAFWDKDSYVASCTNASTCVSRDDIAVFRAQCQLPSMSVPNWMTTLTGAPPEMTGVLGNIFVPDTHFESIYSSAKTAGIMRMVTGTPWFAGIIANQLPFLRGDGTIDAAYDTEETVSSTSAPSDRERLKVALSAEAQTETPYGLMLTHFSDIDSQGHCCGVVASSNSGNTYVEAIHTKADHLRQMLEAMQDDTIAIIVADHGHVDVGGHGGIDRVLRDIPMAVYRRGSNISRVGTVDIRRLDEAGPATVNNLDIAPTVSALLGVSVPGAVTGTFIRPLVDAFVTSPGHRGQHWNDLYAAKWAMTDNFRRTWASAVSATMPNVSSCEVAVAAHGHCADEVAALQGLYVDVLRPGAHFRSPLWLAMLLALVLGVGSLFLLEFTTIASPFSLCKRRALIKDGDSASSSSSSSDSDEECSTPVLSQSDRTMSGIDPAALRSARTEARTFIHRNMLALRRQDSMSQCEDIRHRNMVAIFWTVGGVFAYYLVSVGFFVLFYLALGYPWDSTIIHSPQAAQRYLLVVLCPSTIVAFVFVRAFNLYYHERPPASSWRASWTLRVRRLFFDTYVQFTDSVAVYLVDQYFLLAATWCSLLTLVLASSFTFAYPGVLQQPFVDPSTWGYRFRIITLLGFNVPMVIVALYKNWSWRWINVPRENLEQFLNAQGVELPDELFHDSSTGAPTRKGGSRHRMVPRRGRGTTTNPTSSSAPSLGLVPGPSVPSTHFGATGSWSGTGTGTGSGTGSGTSTGSNGGRGSGLRSVQELGHSRSRDAPTMPGSLGQGFGNTNGFSVRVE